MISNKLIDSAYSIEIFSFVFEEIAYDKFKQIQNNSYKSLITKNFIILF
jgi:hypothetical protein